MKKFFIKSGAVLLMLVMCLGVLSSCNGDKSPAEGTGTVTTTDVVKNEAVNGTGTGTNKKVTFEDLCEGMSEEEIQQVLKDLEDLGMTTDDLVNMLYE